MRVVVRWCTGLTMSISLQAKQTVVALKEEIRRTANVDPETELRLYDDRHYAREYVDQLDDGTATTLQGTYHVGNGRVMHLAPFGMDQVPLVAVTARNSTYTIFPPDAVGHFTGDGKMIMGYDYGKNQFLLTGGQTVDTHDMDHPLVAPVGIIRHNALGKYGQCAIGEVKVLRVARRHVVVQNAEGRKMAMLPENVQALRERTVLSDVRVVINKIDGVMFPKLAVTGGIMNVKDQILSYMQAVHGLTAVGTSCLRRVGGNSVVEPLDRLPRHVGVMLSLETTWKVTPPLPDAQVALALCTTSTSLMAHNYMLGRLDMEPWLLPRSPEALLSLMFPLRDVTFDPSQLREPYAMCDGNIVNAGKAPRITRKAQKYGPEEFVRLVYTGRIRATCRGYVLAHEDGWSNVACTIDLHRKHMELECLHDEVLPLGTYKLDALITDCPVDWIMATFGSVYNPQDGTVTFRDC